MKTRLLIIFLAITNTALAQNPWKTAVEQTLPEYIPLPMDRLFQAGQIFQNKHNTEIKELLARDAESIRAHRELHLETKYFKNLFNGTHEVTTIIQGKRITKAKVVVSNNLIQKFILGNEIYTAPEKLKVPSEIINGYCKVFAEYNASLIPIEFYFTDLYSSSSVTALSPSDSEDLLYSLGEKSIIPVYETPSSISPIFHITKKNQSQVTVLEKNNNTGYAKVKIGALLGYIVNRRIK